MYVLNTLSKVYFHKTTKSCLYFRLVKQKLSYELKELNVFSEIANFI